MSYSIDNIKQYADSQFKENARNFTDITKASLEINLAKEAILKEYRSLGLAGSDLAKAEKHLDKVYEEASKNIKSAEKYLTKQHHEELLEEMNKLKEAMNQPIRTAKNMQVDTPILSSLYKSKTGQDIPKDPNVFAISDYNKELINIGKENIGIMTRTADSFNKAAEKAKEVLPRLNFIKENVGNSLSPEEAIDELDRISPITEFGRSVGDMARSVTDKLKELADKPLEVILAVKDTFNIIPAKALQKEKEANNKIILATQKQIEQSKLKIDKIQSKIEKQTELRVKMINKRRKRHGEPEMTKKEIKALRIPKLEDKLKSQELDLISKEKSLLEYDRANAILSQKQSDLVKNTIFENKQFDKRANGFSPKTLMSDRTLAKYGIEHEAKNYTKSGLEAVKHAIKMEVPAEVINKYMTPNLSGPEISALTAAHVSGISMYRVSQGIKSKSVTAEEIFERIDNSLNEKAKRIDEAIDAQNEYEESAKSASPQEHKEMHEAEKAAKTAKEAVETEAFIGNEEQKLYQIEIEIPTGKDFNEVAQVVNKHKDIEITINIDGMSVISDDPKVIADIHTKLQERGITSSVDANTKGSKDDIEKAEKDNKDKKKNNRENRDNKDKKKNNRENRDNKDKKKDNRENRDNKDKKKDNRENRDNKDKKKDNTKDKIPTADKKKDQPNKKPKRNTDEFDR